MSSSKHAWAIDANVILRFVMRDDEELYAKAASIFQSVEQGDTAICCDPITLAEVVWVLGSFYELPRPEIARELATIVGSPGLTMPHKARYLRALRLYGGSVKHFGDACAYAAALEDCDGRLYSFDREPSAVEGIDRRETVAG